MITSYKDKIYHIQNTRLNIFEIKFTNPKLYCHFDSVGTREYLAIVASKDKASEISLVGKKKYLISPCQ